VPDEVPPPVVDEPDVPAEPVLAAAADADALLAAAVPAAEELAGLLDCATAWVSATSKLDNTVIPDADCPDPPPPLPESAA